MNTAIPKNYSLIATIRALATGTFDKMRSVERDYHSEVEKFDPRADGRQFARVPTAVMAVRDLSTAAGGGYLVGASLGGYVETLKRLSIGLSLGVRTETLDGPAGSLLIPTGGTDPTATWLAAEGTQIPESSPSFGQAAASPKLLAAYIEISRQLLTQSNAEEIVKYRLGVAVAKALDEALLGGSGGSGQPLGIANTSGVGAFTGTSLNYAALVDAQQDVADGEGVENVGALGWATTPTVAGLLAQRYKVASTASPLWEGKLSAGSVCGAPAFASKSLPASTMVFGDWSGATIFEWDSAVISVNPYADFQRGLTGIRLLLMADVLITRPKAFSVASSVS